MPRMLVSSCPVFQSVSKDELTSERLASSVMRSLQFHLRNSEEVRAVLGTRVKLEEPWYGASPSSLSPCPGPPS